MLVEFCNLKMRHSLQHILYHFPLKDPLLFQEYLTSLLNPCLNYVIFAGVFEKPVLYNPPKHFGEKFKRFFRR